MAITLWADLSDLSIFRLFTADRQWSCLFIFREEIPQYTTTLLAYFSLKFHPCFIRVLTNEFLCAYIQLTSGAKRVQITPDIWTAILTGAGPVITMRHCRKAEKSQFRFFIFGGLKSDFSSTFLRIYFFFSFGGLGVVKYWLTLNCATLNPLCQTAVLVFMYCSQLTYSKVFQGMRLNTPRVFISNGSSMGTPLGSLLFCYSQTCVSPCGIPLCITETPVP